MASGSSGRPARATGTWGASEPSKRNEFEEARLSVPCRPEVVEAAVVARDELVRLMTEDVEPFGTMGMTRLNELVETWRASGRDRPTNRMEQPSSGGPGLLAGEDAEGVAGRVAEHDERSGALSGTRDEGVKHWAVEEHA